MAQFIYNYDKWKEECELRGWIITRCECPDEDCLNTERLCKKSIAKDINGVEHSIFKHFITLGVIYE